MAGGCHAGQHRPQASSVPLKCLAALSVCVCVEVGGGGGMDQEAQKRNPCDLVGGRHLHVRAASNRRPGQALGAPIALETDADEPQSAAATPWDGENP